MEWMQWNSDGSRRVSHTRLGCLFGKIDGIPLDEFSQASKRIAGKGNAALCSRLK
jgi:hypothetical protein